MQKGPLFCLVICLLLAGQANAQLLYNQDVITLQAGATLTVQGGVRHAAGSSVNNAGTITLTGDWINNSGTGLLSPDAGTIVFEGITQQVIGGTDPTLFHHLDISATAVSVRLEVNTTVGGNTGVLTLGNQLLLLNRYTLSVTNPATAAIAYTTGTVVGETAAPLGQLSRTTGAGTGSYAFPAGSTTGGLIPLTVDITTAGAGTPNASLVMATYPTGADNLPFPSGVTTLDGQALGTLDRFWIISPQNYTTLPTATVTFSYQDSEWGGSNTITSESSLQIYRWNGSNWEPLPTTNDVIANTLRVTDLNQYGIFTAADISTPLPVRLLTFEARRLSAYENELSWTTVSEENNRGFAIEKSTDARQFTRIGFHDGAGTSSRRQQYRFVDPTAAAAAYYRLKLIDTNGEFSYSKVVFVEASGEGAPVARVYPNPTAGLLHLQIDNARAQPVEIAIISTTGQVLHQNRHDNPGSHFSALLDLSNRAPGVYLVRITVNGASLIRKVIVE